MIPYNFTKSAIKDLLSLPKDAQKRIIEKLEFYLRNENPLIFAKKLVGLPHSTFRFRADDYRIIFDWQGKSVLVLKVGHRKDIYRD